MIRTEYTYLKINHNRFSNGSLDFTRCENMTCVRNFIDVNQRLGNVTQTRLDMDYLRRTYVDRGSKK